MHPTLTMAEGLPRAALYAPYSHLEYTSTSTLIAGFRLALRYSLPLHSTHLVHPTLNMAGGLASRRA